MHGTQIWPERAATEPMRRGKKIWLAVGGAALLSLAALLGVHLYRRGEVQVQSGGVLREDLSSVVTASGEIRP